MKITEDVLNNNAVRIIDDLTDGPFNMIANDEKDLIEERGVALMTLGEIRGVCNLARALKEVLKE